MNRVEKEMPVDWRSEPWSSSSSTCNQQLRSKKAGKRKCIPSEFFFPFSPLLSTVKLPHYFFVGCYYAYFYTSQYLQTTIINISFQFFTPKKRKKNGFCLFCNFSNFQAKNETFFEIFNYNESCPHLDFRKSN